MCGFFGLQSYELDTSEKITLSRKAIDLLHSRGPDSNDLALDDNNNLIFCHNRLSILDLSPMGNQPMKSASGNLLMIYNGEIYNHTSIREELKNTNNFVSWKGTSDTETLIQAVEIWGLEKTLQKINGMFSFAIWNRKLKSLYLARDRFGEKPLYYGWIPQNKSFVFSSDLIFDKLFKQIKFDINEEALNDLFHLNYINNNYSIFKNIYKLEPGYYSEVFFKKDRIPESKMFKYWRTDKIINQKKNIGYKEAIVKLDEKLTNIVKNQIFADVEVGTFLSGGIDSSLITAKAQEVSSKKIKTFCIGVENKNYDESKYAKDVANYLSTEHEELILSEKSMTEEVPSIIGNLNEPFGDSSFIPTYFASKLAKKKVKVVLTGDAGDEIFGGYNRYTQLRNLSKIHALPRSFKKIINSSFSNMSEKNINRINSFAKLFPFFKNQFYLNDKIKKLFDRIDPDLNFSDFIFNFMTNKVDLNLLKNSNTFSKKNIFAIFNQKFSDKKLDKLTLEEKIMYIDTTAYLPNDILFKVDRASMANSVETRAPFLDKDLYDFSFRLSIDQKINKSKGKVILRDLLKTKIPNNLIDRPKGGFSIPIGNWINKPLLDWSENLLSKKNIEKSGLLNFENVSKIWLNHKKGIDNSSLIWSILVFQQWLLNR
tara:strand:+ start:1001 stop:2962 length:1962 start_codon:yes stop_codon:yes gene_type:complete